MVYVSIPQLLSHTFQIVNNILKPLIVIVEPPFLPKESIKILMNGISFIIYVILRHIVFHSLCFCLFNVRTFSINIGVSTTSLSQTSELSFGFTNRLCSSIRSKQ